MMWRNTHSWNIHLVDIARAFAHSECLSAADRNILLVPSFIILTTTHGAEWCVGSREKEYDVEIDTPTTKTTRNHTDSCPEIGLLMAKPLYGARDDPIRWHLELPIVLKSHGYLSLRSDCCIFVKFGRPTIDWPVWEAKAGRGPVSVVMVHDDDLLNIRNDMNFRFSKIPRLNWNMWNSPP